MLQPIILHCEQALPWYTLVRNKVTDPAYAAWFMRFGPPTVGSGWHVPQCDTNYDPPLCTDFYHGKWQSKVLGDGGPLLFVDVRLRCRPTARFCRPGADASESLAGQGAAPVCPPTISCDPMFRDTPLVMATAPLPPATSALCP